MLLSVQQTYSGSGGVFRFRTQVWPRIAAGGGRNVKVRHHTGHVLVVRAVLTARGSGHIERLGPPFLFAGRVTVEFTHSNLFNEVFKLSYLVVIRPGGWGGDGAKFRPGGTALVLRIVVALLQSKRVDVCHAVLAS